MKQPWKRRNFLVPSSKIKRALSKRGNYCGDKEAWNELRNAVFRRDDYKCVACHRGKRDLPEGVILECHHIRPISRGGRDIRSNLATLCSLCHAKQPGHSHLERT